MTKIEKLYAELNDAQDRASAAAKACNAARAAFKRSKSQKRFDAYEAAGAAAEAIVAKCDEIYDQIDAAEQAAHQAEIEAFAAERAEAEPTFL